MQKLQEFKQLLRLNDIAGDPWAVAMGAFFDIASHTYEQGETPSEWEFKVGWGGNHIDTESAYYDLLSECDYDTLIILGNYINRVVSALVKAGLSY